MVEVQVVEAVEDIAIIVEVVTVMQEAQGEEAKLEYFVGRR